MKRRTFLLSSAAVTGTAMLGSRTASSPSITPDPLDAATFREARSFAPTRWGRIAYVERGSGPAALFLHGYPLNGFQWRGALERLSPHRRCTAPDFMGLGYSEVAEHADLSPQAQADMLVELLDALSIPSVDLVANDSGGTVAQLLAVQHPERVRTILLTNCDVHEHSPPPALLPVIEASRAGVFADEFIVRQLEDRAFAHSPEGLGGLAFTDPASLTDEAIEYYFAPLVSSPARKAQFHRYATAFEPNPLVAIEPALRRCAIPVRMVWGLGDPLFPVSLAEWLDRTMPQSRGVRRVEGARLFFPEELPDLIAKEARELWRGSPGRVEGPST